MGASQSKDKDPMMTCEMACCCFNCVGCKLAGTPPDLKKSKGSKAKMEMAGAPKDSLPVPAPASAAEPKDDDDVITTTLGLANGVHFAFNYCLFCSVTPIQQAS